MSEPEFSRQLSPSDRLMWNIERDPVLRSPIVVVGLLDREPDWDSVRATFTRAAERVPRFRQRISRTSPGPRGLRWVDDPQFSIGYHVRRVRAPRSRDLRAVLDLAAPSACASFDAARPPWELTLVEGLDGGGAAFVLRFHHTVADGVGAIDLAGEVFDRTRRGTAPRAEPITRPPRSEPERPWMPAANAVRAGLQQLVHPTQTLSDATRLSTSIARMLAPARPMSPVLTGRGLDRRLDTLEMPLASMRAAAGAVDGTINDVFLAAVGGALSQYHRRLGSPVSSLQITMPINLRTEGDPRGGNRFTPARFVLPIDDDDPAARARVAGAITRRWRAEPAVGMTNVLAAVLDQLPAAAVTRIFGGLLKNVDVDVVNVPGLGRRVYLGGAAIDRMWAFAPPTGAALSITLLSHVDTCCVAVLTDEAAVTDPEVLTTCLAEALHDVAALGTPNAVTTKEAVS